MLPVKNKANPKLPIKNNKDFPISSATFDNKFGRWDWTMSSVGLTFNYVLVQNANHVLVVHWDGESPKNGVLEIPLRELHAKCLLYLHNILCKLVSCGHK